MKKNYGVIQEQQFYEFQYPATQDMFLFVKPSSDNYVQLNKSIVNQFHRFYVKGENIFDISGFDGIVLVDGDVELMSSTLAYFASALQKGYDFIYSDVAYGGMAQTEVLYPDNYTGGYKINFAVISAELANKISRNLLSKHNVLNCTETLNLNDASVAIFNAQSIPTLIALAASMAEKPCHLNKILLNYRKPLTATDLFYQDKQNALIFCHEFSLTGAPIVLSEAIKYIDDYQLFVMGPEKDVVVNDFLSNDVPVILNRNVRQACDVTSIAFSFNLVIANTILMSNVVDMLSGSNTPVMWWLHDNPLVYTNDIYTLDLCDNIKIFCVSDYARQCFQKYQPQAATELLPYVVTDCTDAKPSETISIPSQGKVLFTSIGSINPIKGQDLLCTAIELLPEKILKNCLFYFIGNQSDKMTFAKLAALCEKYPENVVYGHTVPHDKISAVFSQSDCLICASRFDPLPTFITEGWMFGKFCLCSKNTGTVSYIKDGLNGYVIDPDNSPEFANYITKVVKERPYKNKKVAKFCRQTYLNNFTPEVFSKNIKAALIKTIDFCH